MISIKEQLKDWYKFLQAKTAEITVDTEETAAQQEVRIKKLEANPEQWFAYYFPTEKAKPAKFHKEATKRIIQNPEWYEVRMWSRECAKSTRTMFETLYLVLTERKRHVLLVSSTHENAARLLMPYKVNLESNARIIHDYGKQETLGQWTSSEFIIKNGAAFRAVGIGEPPRGAKTAKNERPDVLLFDDCDTDQDVRNPDMVKKTWEWIENATIGTRSISAPTLIIFCGNRIAKDCCVVRASTFADHTDIVNILDGKGHPTWPEKNSIEQINRALAQKSYLSVQKEYFNNPIVEGTVFKEMNYKPALPIEKYSHLVCYTDPSYRESKKSDYKATVLIGKIGDEFHVIKAFVEQCSIARMIEWHYEIKAIVGNKSCYYRMEEVFLQGTIIQEFYNYAKAKNTPIIPISGDTRKKDDKFIRIDALLEPLVRNYKLFLNEKERDNPGMKRLDEQFICFAPGSKAHDDGPDACEGGIWMLNELSLRLKPGATTIFKKQNSKRF